MKKWLFIVTIFIIIFLGGILTNHYWLSKAPRNTANNKQKVLYWVAPMDPTFRRDKPGKSPMGMDLVPVYATNSKQVKNNIVKISPAVENNLGVRTAIVNYRNMPRIINTVGHVSVDENSIEHIHSYTDAWIKELYVKTSGAIVKKGQLLLELYSPTLNNAQEELLLAMENNNKALIRAGKKKLLTLGMAQSQINDLVKTKQLMQRVKIFATQGGYVAKLNAREGKFIKPDIDLMTIEDLSKIWIIADVFERQAGWVRKGQAAIASLAFAPNKTWHGKVEYIYPVLNKKTHTVLVRLSFSNPDLVLKPKMYASVKILGDAIKHTLVIPKAALIQTQEGDRVILALGKGRYKAQAVKVGIESEGLYQIISGLKAGDYVVTSAQFLLDSESSIKASFNRMNSHNKGSK